MYSIHINYIFATSWFFCLFLPTSPFKALRENEAIETVNSLIGCTCVLIYSAHLIDLVLSSHNIKQIKYQMLVVVHKEI